MKKITHNTRRSVTPVKIYLDDLKKIIELLTEAKPRTLEISTKNYTLSFEELQKLDKDIVNYLSITCYDPHISLEFNSNAFVNDVSIFANEDSPQVVGLAEKIITILKKRRKIITRLQSQTYAWGLIAIYAVIFGIYAITFKNTIFNDDIFSWPYLILLFVIGQVLYALPSVQKNIIVLDYKKSRPNFLMRKKDDILLIIFSTTFGAVLYALIDNFLVK